jgi:hypothetical protein
VPEPARAEAQVAPRLAVSGFVHAQYSLPREHSGDGLTVTDGFSLRRVRLRFRGEVVQGVGYTVMLEPLTPANLVRDGFVSLTLLPRHELRLGQQKTLFGHENWESATRLLVINRSYASETLGRGPDLRDLGVGLLGQWALPRGLGLEYGVTVVNGAGPNVLRDDTPGKNLYGRVGGSWRLEGRELSVRLGASLALGDHLAHGAAGEPPDALSGGRPEPFRRAGVDLVVESPWLLAVAEALWGQRDALARREVGHGFYVLAAGRTPWAVGPVLRYEELEPQRSLTGDRLRRWTAGAYLDVASLNARLMLNYELDASERPRDDGLLLFAQVVF